MKVTIIELVLEHVQIVVDKGSLFVCNESRHTANPPEKFRTHTITSVCFLFVCKPPHLSIESLQAVDSARMQLVRNNTVAWKRPVRVLWFSTEMFLVFGLLRHQFSILFYFGYKTRKFFLLFFLFC